MPRKAPLFTSTLQVAGGTLTISEALPNIARLCIPCTQVLSAPASFAVLGSYGNHPLRIQQLIPYTPGLVRKLAPTEAACPSRVLGSLSVELGRKTQPSPPVDMAMEHRSSEEGLEGLEASH
jgi:hypothetical protein